MNEIFANKFSCTVYEKFGQWWSKAVCVVMYLCPSVLSAMFIIVGYNTKHRHVHTVIRKFLIYDNKLGQV